MKTVSARYVREFQVKGKTEKRTEWQGQDKSKIGGGQKRSGRLVGAAETSNRLFVSRVG